MVIPKNMRGTLQDKLITINLCRFPTRACMIGDLILMKNENISFYMKEKEEKERIIGKTEFLGPIIPTTRLWFRLVLAYLTFPLSDTLSPIPW